MSLSPAASAKILIVEDEPRLASVLRDYLAAAGMTSEWVDDGGQVIDAFARYQPDLVLLDLMLPQRDGVDLCRELRAGSDVPVIMVTARVEEIDRLLGLDSGRVTTTRSPPSGEGSAWIWPWWARMMLWLMARPSPLPPLARLRELSTR